MMLLEHFSQCSLTMCLSWPDSLCYNSYLNSFDPLAYYMFFAPFSEILL